MKWLYDEQVVTAMFTWLIVLTPAAALVGAALHWRLARRSASEGELAGGCSRGALVVWAVLGLLGPFNYGLWHLYNAIEDHWGLDRVEPLLINFGLFVFLGLVIGLLLRSLLRSRSQPRETGAQPTDEALKK